MIACVNTFLRHDRERPGYSTFGGVGAPLLEAYLHGYNVVGFEINIRGTYDFAVMEEAGVSARLSRFEKYEVFMDEYCGVGSSTLIQPRSKRPEGFSGRTELFGPLVERKVLFTLDFIKSVRNRSVRDLFKLGFGAVMVSFSNYTYEPSLTRRVAVGKPPVIDADLKMSWPRS